MGLPVEDCALANAIENICSLYRRSSATLSTLKAACTARRVPPPPSQLDDAIDSAVIDIEKEVKKAVRRFESRFENGDGTAINALAEVERELRTGLFVKVRFATFSENEDLHGPELVDTADWARDQTMLVLLDFKQRLWQSSEECPAAQRKGSTATNASQGSRRSVDQGQPGRKLTRVDTLSSIYGDDDDTASGAEDARRKRNSSILGFLKHHRVHSKETGAPGDQTPKQSDIDFRRYSQAPGIQTSPNSTSGQPPQPDASRSGSISTGGSSGSQQNKNSTAYAEWREQLSKIEQNPANHDRHDSSATVRAPSPQPGKPRHSSTAPSMSSSLSSMKPAYGGSVTVPTPTPDNSYLGFCKNAVKLQNGEKKAAFEKRKEFNDGWSQSSVYFLACASAKCCFAGHINLDMIWSKAITAEKRGVKFRWAFLAKSHVQQSKVHARQYQFQCLFCVYVSGQSTTYTGTDAYLDHVSSQHRGESFSDVVLYKCGAVTDRVCEDKEEFDINVWPLGQGSGDVGAGRKQSAWSDFGLQRTFSHQSTNSTTDSVMETVQEEEPWNAGLSDFHMQDDYIKSDDFD